MPPPTPHGGLSQVGTLHFRGSSGVCRTHQPPAPRAWGRASPPPPPPPPPRAALCISAAEATSALLLSSRPRPDTRFPRRHKAALAPNVLGGLRPHRDGSHPKAAGIRSVCPSRSAAGRSPGTEARRGGKGRNRQGAWGQEPPERKGPGPRRWRVTRREGSGNHGAAVTGASHTAPDGHREVRGQGSPKKGCSEPGLSWRRVGGPHPVPTPNPKSEGDLAWRYPQSNGEPWRMWSPPEMPLGQGGPRRGCRDDGMFWNRGAGGCTALCLHSKRLNCIIENA
ncbi:uncharacterized protein LOC114226127 [Eumetopias jubatus]|uniref:uncharacterized protein LOC114226127 n=1 Tax=Eumetopias jubatus TaxID=34886 RepID=UPI00101701F3|nr:uncharacterized protein LOC114226127 [Eumetopias jubatus]